MTFRRGVETTLRQRDMLKGGERVLVAVSGGPDSLALLYVLHDLAAAWSLDLHVAHFDHRLRAGSAADAAYVARVARRLGLPATTGSAAPEPAPAGLSPEEAARERRLAFFDVVADAVAADRIATGHTLDDQAETVLMRLLVGTGTRGLGGIPPVRGRYIRPLIDRRRAETEAFCRARRIRPRRDPTNDDDVFLRNALRNEVIPYLTDRVNARLPQALARTADIAREEDALLDGLASEALEAESSPGIARIPLDALNAMPLALRRRAIRACLSAPVDFSHIERVIELASSGTTGDALDLPEGLNARLEYGSLLLGRVASRVSAPDSVELIVPGRTPLPGWDGVVTVWEERVRPTKWPDGRGTCVVDADRVTKRLVVRSRRAGDRIAPLGTAGTKSVADVLTDAKVPRGQRASVPLVVTGADVAWIVGHGVSEAFKVTESTKRYLWMSFKRGTLWPS